MDISFSADSVNLYFDKCVWFRHTESLLVKGSFVGDNC